MKLNKLIKNILPILMTLMTLVFVSCGNMQSVVSTDDGIYADDPAMNSASTASKVADNQQDENGFIRALRNVEAQDKVNRIANSYKTYDNRKNGDVSPYNTTRIDANSHTDPNHTNTVYIVNTSPNFGIYSPFWNDYYGYNYYNQWNYGYFWRGGLGVYGQSLYDSYLPYNYDNYGTPYRYYTDNNRNNYHHKKRPFASNTFRRKRVTNYKKNYNFSQRNSVYSRPSTTVRRNTYPNKKYNTSRVSRSRNYPNSSRKRYVRSNVKVKRR